MLYHLLAPLARQHIFFNLFNYITFRAAGATVTALLLASSSGPGSFASCASIASARSSAPKAPRVIRASAVRRRWRPHHHSRHGRADAAVGAARQPLRDRDGRRDAVDGIDRVFDDYLKIVRGQSQGLVARWKLVGQVSFGIGLGIFLLTFPLTNSVEASATQLPFFKYIIVVLPWWPTSPS